MKKQNKHFNSIGKRILFSFFFLVGVISQVAAQSKQPTKMDLIIKTPELYSEIARMDSLLFKAYNTHNLDLLKTFFTEDLEFYHDKDGLITYNQMVNGFKNILERNDGINRQLVKASLQVYPMGSNGAIEIGEHRFCHVENGKDDCGNFQFVHVWRKLDGQWKISRVISYGH